MATLAGCSPPPTPRRSPATTPGRAEVEPALFVLAIVVTVAFVAGASRRLGWSPPLVLVVVGVVASFIPGIPTFELDPELVLIGLLPLLLYAAAIRTSLIDFRSVRDALILLAVVLVAVTTVLVGLVAWWLVPSLSLAAHTRLSPVAITSRTPTPPHTRTRATRRSAATSSDTYEPR